jgi:hypothetical protein
MNRILAQVVALLSDNQKRYPDDIFAGMLGEKFEVLHLNLDRIFFLLADGPRP